MIEKITARVHSWSARLISYAGRLQLISTILESMYNYWCTVFLLPKKIIKEVERICCSFLRKGNDGPASGAKVSWDKVCTQKDEGDLGLKRLLDWNIACLASIVWMLFRGSDSLWIAWVRENLLKGKSCWDVNINANGSWCWRILLKLRCTFKKMVFYEVGDGQKIYLWHDNWHPKGPLLLNYGARSQYLTALPLNAKLSVVINGLNWGWPPSRTVELREIASMLNCRTKGGEDIVKWAPSKSSIR